MFNSNFLAPCTAWRFLFTKLTLVSLSSLLISGSAIAGESTKPVSIKCDGRIYKDLSSVDKSDFAYALITRSMAGKKMDMEPMRALGELDMMLTSSYGLRRPLATISNARAKNQMAIIAQLIMSGYVVSAKMLIGVVEKEAILPAETVRISKNMIYTLHEPTGDDDVLLTIENKVKKADPGVSGISIDRQPFARWVVRGYAYNDPVAVDAAIAGYCSVVGPSADDRVLSGLSRAVRFDPRGIRIEKK